MKYYILFGLIFVGGLFFTYEQLQAPDVVSDVDLVSSSTPTDSVPTSTASTLGERPGFDGTDNDDMGGVEMPTGGGGTSPTVACVRGGCSGQLCVSASAEPMATTCEWRESYACYQSATCEVQPSGQCGWTPTSSLTQCLATDGAS